MKWLKQAIPNFSALLEAFHLLLKSVYEKAGITKPAAGCAALSDLNWSKTQSYAFQSCKFSLANQITLAHVVELKRFCITLTLTTQTGPEW